MATNWFKKEHKPWHYDLLGVIVSILILLILIIDYDNQVLRDNFGSTNDKMMNFIMRFLDKEGGKFLVFSFFIIAALFFCISAWVKHHREKGKK